MVLDFSNIRFDSFGRVEQPELILQRPSLAGSPDVIGVLTGVSGLNITVRYSEPSEMDFDISSVIGEDLTPNPFFDEVTGYKIIYTEDYGTYIIMNPEEESDGIMDVKHIHCYSYEKLLETKTFFLESGTYNFWNPASQTDTVLGRILEVATEWSVGYVSPTLIGKYRTFDEYDDFILSFMYDTAPVKYRCVFVFDTNLKTINVYDADETVATLPIYLDFDNLINTVSVTEVTDELVTALRPHGSDMVDIREVNPIGTNWMYNLSYFIENRDIPSSLATKWNGWLSSIVAQQETFRGYIGLSASSLAKSLTIQAKINDMNGDLTSLENQQSVTIQAQALETTEAGRQAQQEILDGINSQITSKKSEISSAQTELNTIQSEYLGYQSQIQSIVDSLKLTSYFTDTEQNVLSHYFIEQDITEDTFVASTIDSTVSGTIYSPTNLSASISGADITKVTISSKDMYSIKGGSASISCNISGSSKTITFDIIRGTIERRANSTFVASFYAGTINVGGTTSPSGLITLSGSYSSFTGFNTETGSSVSFSSSGCDMFLTANISDYQRYSVSMELYDFAYSVLGDLATPTYEFSVNSGNFLFAQEFDAFRNQFELGKSVYLRLADRSSDQNEVITPVMIECSFNFDDESSFDITFSNRFKRHDECSSLKSMIESSYSTSRSFDAGKYIYNQTTSHASEVSRFMSSALDAAVNNIIAASNQSVVINGSGINVGGSSNNKLRITDSMLVFTDDNWSTAKLAIGQFATSDTGTYFGVNAEVVAGKLIVGNNLIIENEIDGGVMQFKVDSTGAWLNNSTFILQKDSGGKILIDPDSGIVAGNGNLFSVSGTTVTPSFIDQTTGDIIYDSDGFPVNSNFYLDLNDGSAFFRGTFKATSGSIGGWTVGENSLYAGSGASRVTLDASANSTYAIWAGSNSAASAPFSVTKSGELKTTSGTISGWGASATSLSSGSGNSYVALDSGTGNYSIWAGKEDAASAPFSVTSAGSLTSTSGTIGGWTIGTSLHSASVQGSNRYIGLDASGTSDSSYAIWAGNSTAGSAPFSVTMAGSIKATSGKIGDWTIGAGSLYSGSGSNYVALNSSTDGTYAIWAGSSTAASAPFSVKKSGEIKSTSGTIGSWTIGSDSLSSGSGSSYVALNGSTSNTYAMWAGNSTASSAPFSVTNAGALKSTSGTIGSWIIGTNDLHSGSGNNYVALNGSTSNTYAMWAGNETASSAPFSVTMAGAIKSTSGTIGGWIINANELYSGSGSSFVALNTATSGTNANYAFWAGASNAADADFWVKKTGEVRGTGMEIVGGSITGASFETVPQTVEMNSSRLKIENGVIDYYINQGSASSPNWVNTYRIDGGKIAGRGSYSFNIQAGGTINIESYNVLNLSGPEVHIKSTYADQGSLYYVDVTDPHITGRNSNGTLTSDSWRFGHGEIYYGTRRFSGAETVLLASGTPLIGHTVSGKTTYTINNTFGYQAYTFVCYPDNDGSTSSQSMQTMTVPASEITTTASMWQITSDTHSFRFTLKKEYADQGNESTERIVMDLVTDGTHTSYSRINRVYGLLGAIKFAG